MAGRKLFGNYFNNWSIISVIFQASNMSICCFFVLCDIKIISLRFWTKTRHFIDQTINRETMESYLLQFQKEACVLWHWGTDGETLDFSCIYSRTFSQKSNWFKNIFSFLFRFFLFYINIYIIAGQQKSTWSQKKNAQSAQMLAREYIPAVVKLTQRNVFHTHTSHSLWKSHQTSLFLTKEGGGGGEGREPRIGCERKASVTVTHRWYHRTGVCWDQWRMWNKKPADRRPVRLDDK